jgi:hypothetical protein
MFITTADWAMRSAARYAKNKPNKTGHPSTLVLKQQTEGAAIKNRKGSSWGGGYI